MDEGPAPHLRRGRVVHGGRVSVSDDAHLPRSRDDRHRHAALDARHRQQPVVGPRLPAAALLQRGPDGAGSALRWQTTAGTRRQRAPAEGADLRQRAERGHARPGPRGLAVPEACLGDDARGAEGRRRAVGPGRRAQLVDDVHPVAGAVDRAIPRWPSHPGGLRQVVGPPRQGEGLQVRGRRRRGEAAVGVGHEVPAHDAAALGQADHVLLRGVGRKPVCGRVHRAAGQRDCRLA